jgi:NAD(P)-dependent dehydrogenase (short-subunit alcohol dehydrogenase family)
MTPDKKVALITGANRGLGFETARQLGQQGITVVLGARKLKSAEEAAAKLKLDGIDAYGIQLDVVSQAIAWLPPGTLKRNSASWIFSSTTPALALQQVWQMSRAR